MNTETYFLAIAKMLDEIATTTDDQLHAIHNWLCDQENDSELMAGILKENRTIAGAMEYCGEKARNQAEQGARFAMIDYSTVFDWVREYFLLDETPKEKREREAKEQKKSKPTTKKAATKNKKADDKKSVSIDSFLENENAEEGPIQLDLFGEL
ncbi:hypothetical protein HO924_10940 [Streptococcus suis]|nr:hypothetical protein [Streptococcus suis]